MQCRRGFTLLELLVVTAIIGMLAALALPAAQAARESARRMKCRNHLKQLALALHNYHDSFGTLPSAAYCGVPGSSSIQHCHVWVESLLPYLEEQNWYGRINFNVANHVGGNPAALNERALDLLMCPSDPESGLYPNSREANYTPGSGNSLGASYLASAGPLHLNLCPVPALTPNINCKGINGARLNDDAPGMFAGGWRGYRFRDCTDGLSNTFLLGETLPVYNTFHMYFASHLHIGSTNPPPNYQKQYTACPQARNARVGDCYAYMGGFKSAHPGGVQMALADGSVSFIKDNIDYSVWCFLGDKSDGEPVAAF